MCPLCLSATAWLGLGGSSAAGLTVLIALIRRKGDFWALHAQSREAVKQALEA